MVSFGGGRGGSGGKILFVPMGGERKSPRCSFGASIRYDQRIML